MSVRWSLSFVKSTVCSTRYTPLSKGADNFTKKKKNSTAINQTASELAQKVKMMATAANRPAAPSCKVIVTFIQIVKMSITSLTETIRHLTMKQMVAQPAGAICVF